MTTTDPTLAERISDALVAYAHSHVHDYGGSCECTSVAEGQYCCTDPESRGHDTLVAAILEALEGRDPRQMLTALHGGRKRESR